MCARGAACFCWFTLLFALLAPLQVMAAPAAKVWDFWLPELQQSSVFHSHGLWQEFLDRNLVADHPSGIHRVRYGAVTRPDRKLLRDYLGHLQGIDPRTLPRAQQKAYWINLYNALTVNLVLENYPVTSIRKIRPHFFAFGPWDMDVAEVAGQELTLNDIEHRILRPIFQDARIHFAVNCASLGCPNLAPRAYVAEQLDGQLDAASREFLAHPRGLQWQPDGLFLSSIFKWFDADFGGRAGVLRFLARYAPAAARERLRGYQGDITYDYDWQLNDLP